MRFGKRENKPHERKEALLGAWGSKRVLAFLFATLSSSMWGAEVSLSWNDNSDNELGFEVERSIDGQSFAFLESVAADVTNYVDQTVEAGTQYSYRVRAFNEFGVSSYTNIATALLKNTAPTVSAFGDLSVPRGEPEAIRIPFTISDAETNATQLVIEPYTTDESVLSLDALSIEGQGRERYLVLDASASAVGSVVVGVDVSDGAAVSSSEFNVEIVANTAPSVGSISSKSVYEGAWSAWFALAVKDAESAIDSLVLTGTSLKEGAISSEDIQFLRSNGTWWVRLRPAMGASGAAAIRVSASDGVNTGFGQVSVWIFGNTAPTLTASVKSGLTMKGNSTLSGIEVGVSDSQSKSSELEIEVVFSNSDLFAEDGYRVNGSGDDRTISLTPMAGKTGTSDVTIRVIDGSGAYDEYTFTVTVEAPADVIEIVRFYLEDMYPVIEIENRSSASVLKVWKSSDATLDSWEEVAVSESVVGGETTVLYLADAVSKPVFYRVSESVVVGQ